MQFTVYSSHLFKTFSVRRETFQKQYFSNIFLLLNFCQDHDSHKGSNWNLFRKSTTLLEKEDNRKRVKYVFRMLRLRRYANM